MPRKKKLKRIKKSKSATKSGKKRSVVSKKKSPKKSKRKIEKKTQRTLKKKKNLRRAPKRRVRVTGKKKRPLELERSHKNPVLGPSDLVWQSQAAFNPGAVIHGDRIHLFYRALGNDGISRVGYASTKDGINFDKQSEHPVYMPEAVADSIKKHHPNTSPARLKYDKAMYVSGGGWGGCEDPRTVKIENRIYMTFNIFNGWYSIRVGLTSIDEKDLENEIWKWTPLVYLSPINQRHKNWVLFPEKINGKFALLHNLHHSDPNQVCIVFVDNIEDPLPDFKSHDPQLVPDRDLGWHNRMRSVGPPPVRTPYGWLLFYHAMEKNDHSKYKLGAMLLDLEDPRKIIYRSHYPILEPEEWYENDWKPGIIYASGAVVKDNTLYIYYGGGDKHIGVAYTDVRDFVNKLMRNEHLVLRKKTVRVK